MESIRHNCSTVQSILYRKVIETWLICPWRGTAFKPRFLNISVTLKRYNNKKRDFSGTLPRVGTDGVI